MRKQFTLARAVGFPTEASVGHAFGSVDLADAFAIALPASASSDPAQLARFLFSHQPTWIGALLKVRDAIMGRLGVKTASGLAKLADAEQARRIGIFKVYRTSDSEIVLGEDDSHLDFRLSLLCSGNGSGERQLTIATVVQCHNRLGRGYLFAIAPFHRMVVKASLRAAARRGWPPCAARFPVAGHT